jgi:hypothetical protein
VTGNLPTDRFNAVFPTDVMFCYFFNDKLMLSFLLYILLLRVGDLFSKYRYFRYDPNSFLGDERNFIEQKMKF